MITNSVSAKPQQQPKSADFPRCWQILVKNCCRFITGNLKAFFLYFCFDFLHSDPSNDFVSATFLPSEGERLKVKFWSLEMVQIGRDQHIYCRCRCRHRLQSFVTMKTTVKSDQQWMPWEIPKKICILAVAILFLFTFFNLILDAPRVLADKYSS